MLKKTAYERILFKQGNLKLFIVELILIKFIQCNNLSCIMVEL